MGVEEFLMAFRQFTSRQGVPATFISDNAKAFSCTIVKITRSAEVSCYLVDNQINWNFIVERDPWWGRFWERFQSVNRCLCKVIGGQTLGFEQLRT